MRGKRAPVRKLPPDPVYGSEVVTKLINFVMKDGKIVERGSPEELIALRGEYYRLLEAQKALPIITK